MRRNLCAKCNSLLACSTSGLTSLYYFRWHLRLTFLRGSFLFGTAGTLWCRVNMYVTRSSGHTDGRAQRPAAVAAAQILKSWLLSLRLPPDDVLHELQRWSFINMPERRRKKTKGSQSKTETYAQSLTLMRLRSWDEKSKLSIDDRAIRAMCSPDGFFSFSYIV